MNLVSFEVARMLVWPACSWITLADPFISKEEIIKYLSSIYKDPFKV